MRKAVIAGAIWVAVVVAMYFAGTMLYDWDALDRQPDGWCELGPAGAPTADDPDCEDWNVDASSLPLED